MSRFALIVLGGLGMILSGIIAVEVHDARRPLVPPLAAAKLPLQGVVSPAPDRSAALVAALLARPLFSRSRRPPAVAAGAVAKRPGLPRLSGILISPAGKSAIFSPPGGKPIIAREGGRVAGFTVRSITANKVIIAGPEGITVLHTVFSVATGAGPTTPPPRPPFAGIAGITGTPGGIALDHGKPDLPSAATWPGPPGLSSLPAAPPHPASAPLLKPPSPGAGPAG